MLRGTETRRTRARRPLPSLRQQYHEYVLERIETYKNSLGRSRLMELGAEAAADMQDSGAEQFLLTEVLMQEAVDKLIMRRLKLPTFSRWKQTFANMRKAQREPTRWGLEPDCALAALLPRIEPEDIVLVVGPGAEPAAYLLAAYDASVTFIASDLGAVERVESGFANEALAATAECYFVQPGCWLPNFGGPLDLVVLDAGSLGEVEPVTRARFVSELMQRTGGGGVHVILPGNSGLAPEALVSMYDGWSADQVARTRRRGSARRSTGVVLTCPGEDTSSEAAES